VILNEAVGSSNAMEITFPDGIELGAAAVLLLLTPYLESLRLFKERKRKLCRTTWMDTVPKSPLRVKSSNNGTLLIASKDTETLLDRSYLV
jgi:hypothetical protein